jgi:hypothetical protein
MGDNSVLLSPFLSLVMGDNSVLLSPFLSLVIGDNSSFQLIILLMHKIHELKSPTHNNNPAV